MVDLTERESGVGKLYWHRNLWCGRSFFPILRNEKKKEEKVRRVNSLEPAKLSLYGPEMYKKI